MAAEVSASLADLEIASGSPRDRRRYLLLAGLALVVLALAVPARLPGAWLLHLNARHSEVAIACAQTSGTLRAGTCTDAAIAIAGTRRLRAGQLSWRLRLGWPLRFDVQIDGLRLDGIGGDPILGDYRLRLRPGKMLTGEIESLSATALLAVQGQFSYQPSSRTFHLQGSAQPATDAPADLVRAITLLGGADTLELRLTL